MPLLDRDLTLRLMDHQFGLSAAEARGEKPENGVRLLAELTGISRRTLSGIVHGRDPAKPYRVALIAKALGVKPGVLMADPPQPKPDPPAPKREPTAPPPRRREPTAPPRGKAEAAA